MHFLEGVLAGGPFVLFIFAIAGVVTQIAKVVVTLGFESLFKYNSPSLLLSLPRT